MRNYLIAKQMRNTNYAHFTHYAKIQVQKKYFTTEGRWCEPRNMHFTFSRWCYTIGDPCHPAVSSAGNAPIIQAYW